MRSDGKPIPTYATRVLFRIYNLIGGKIPKNVYKELHHFFPLLI